jgi:hypothetical protein
MNMYSRRRSSGWLALAHAEARVRERNLSEVQHGSDPKPREALMRTLGVIFIALGVLITLDSLLQVVGVIPGSGGSKWIGPVLLLSGAGLVSRRTKGAKR